MEDWWDRLRFTLTEFPDKYAKRKLEHTLSMSQLAGRLRSQTAASKADLPFGKLAEFGDQKDPRSGSYRHDANVRNITGVEGDYDGEMFAVEQAQDLAEEIGLLCIITTSPSYTEERPRWRIFCPTSKPLDPKHRIQLVNRLNGAFRGIFAVESWTLSQSYYLGSPLVDGKRKTDHQVFEVRGRPIDLMTELDAGAIGKPDTIHHHAPGNGHTDLDHTSLDQAAVVKALVDGQSIHVPALRLVAKWANEEVPVKESHERLLAMFEACPEGVKGSKRWVERRENDVPRILEWVYGKEIARDLEIPPAPPPARDEDLLGWLRAQLQKSGKRSIAGNAFNLTLLACHDPRLEGMVCFNEFNAEITQLRPPATPENIPMLPGPYPRAMTEADAIGTLIYVQSAWSRFFKSGDVLAGLVVAARQHAHHPVREWLNTLSWDGVPRVDHWLEEVFDAVPDAKTRKLAAITMIAAVRRVREPGSKFDNVLILEGAEGIGKSTAIRVLFGEHWFTDSLHADLAHKDAPQGLLGNWCVEIGEIERFFIRNSGALIKNFVAKKEDNYRPPYGKLNQKVKRQCVFIGTTNRDDYLTEETGTRRFWPIKCLLGHGYSRQFADLEWLEANREQLWAEAAYREAQGEGIDIKDENVAKSMRQDQNERMAEDPWDEPVTAFAAVNWPVTVATLLADAVAVPKDKQTKALGMRVAEILKSNGFVRAKRSGEGGQRWRWYPNQDAVRGG